VWCFFFFSENGDPDEERGVHAPVPVHHVAAEQYLLDCIRPCTLRPVPHCKSLNQASS
jgi:hypothetical protein